MDFEKSCLMSAILLVSGAFAEGAVPAKTEHKVLDVYTLSSSDPGAHSAEVGLNDNITVVVENLGQWTPAMEAKPKIVPYINGMAIKGNYPISINTTENTIIFRLKRIQDASSDNREAWTALLRRPGFNEHSRPVEVSIGTEDGREILKIARKSRDAGALRLVVLPSWWWAVGVLLLVLVVALFYLAITSNILRDSDLEPFKADDRKPYSLARVQMAVWFILIIVSYATIWAITGDLGNIPDTVLGLMGISAGTAIAAVSIDSSRRAERRQTLSEERKKLEDSIAQLQSRIAAAPPDIDRSRADLNDKKAKLEQLNPKSINFFIDILSDADGVSFHRFQMFAWTLVLAFIFFASTYNVLAMPEFNGALLGLMGISAGTYIGFKVPEKKT